MEQSKLKGISKEEYQKIQAVKEEEDFKFSTNQRVQNMLISLNNLEKKLYDLESLQGSDTTDLSSQILEVMNSTMSSLKEFRQVLGDFKTDMDSHISFTKKIHLELSRCVRTETFEAELKEINGFFKEILREKESMKKEINSLIERQKTELIAKMDATKTEIIAIPSELPAFKHLMDQKLELVELNGQNSVLRSANNEKHIMLVERKIENLYQLVKKIDLSIGENK